MCANNGDPFIATVINVLLAPDLCENLFSILFIPQRVLYGVIRTKREKCG